MATELLCPTSKTPGALVDRSARSHAPLRSVPKRVEASGKTEDRTSGIQKLSILIPVFNERYTVCALIERVRQAPLPAGMQRELIIVDDCSTDATRSKLEQLATQHPDEIRLVRHAANQGKGAAVRTAIGEATGDICLVQDADLEYDPMDYAALLEPILNGDADAVFGSRFAARSQRRVLHNRHALGNRFLTALSNLFTDLNLTDMETCYKAVRTEILKSLPIRSNRFGIEPELTAKLAKRRVRIYEVPISYHARTYEEGKKITWWDGVKALFAIVYFGIVDDVYNEKYGHAILHRLSSTHRFNSWMANQVEPWVGESVLEIGAGLGNLSTTLMPREHYTLSDVDLLYLQYLRNHFASRPYATVATVDLENHRHFDTLNRKFDTIVCLNVLEHVETDMQALRNMYDALQPGGCALVLVPHGRWLFGSLDTVLGHFRRYSKTELSEKCKQVGFEVERRFTFNRISVLPWFLNARILRRKYFGRMQLKAFDALVWLWKRIDPFLPWAGLSLIVVARKAHKADAASKPAGTLMESPVVAA
ncbi:MAG: glycosyltransferase [Phycisphaerales bacterium]|nr:MAG: glycosyltransferase [Phycisphaerales bacterium]